ncbi:ankyrin repeat-containing domain protein [Aspergillus filifer]
MPYSTLPTETIIHIASFLLPDYTTQNSNIDPGIAALNAWIRTSKWHASLLLPLSYDHVLLLTPSGRKRAAEIESKPECWSETLPFEGPWRAAPQWRSEMMTEYLFDRRDQIFNFKWLEKKRDKRLPSYRHFSLLAALVSAGANTMLERLLVRDDIRRHYVNTVHPDEWTPLRTAILVENSTALKILIEAGADTAHTTASGQTPLHLAAKEDFLEGITLLIEAGADVWAIRDEDPHNSKYLPIHDALKGGDGPRYAQPLLQEMLKTEHRAPSKDWKLEVFRHAVANHGANLRFAYDLLDSGMDVFVRDRWGTTALDMVEDTIALHDQWMTPSCDGCWRLRQLAARMLQSEPYIWPQGHINRHFWEYAQSGSVAEKSDLVLFNLLIRTGQSVLEVVGTDGFTPLHYLCSGEIPPLYDATPRHGYRRDICKRMLNMISFLLDNGASLSTLDDRGRTPLLLASSTLQSEYVKLIMDKRPNDPAVNLSADGEVSGKTPLLAAVNRGSPTLVQLLLNNGADVSVIDTDGSSALHRVINTMASHRIIETLINAGCPLSTLHPQWGSALQLALTRGYRQAIKSLVEAGCSLYLRDMQGETALRTALHMNDLRSMRLFLRLEGRQLVEFDDGGSGGLICAGLESVSSWRSCGDRRKAIRLLIEYGAVAHEGCQTCHRWRTEVEYEIKRWKELQARKGYHARIHSSERHRDDHGMKETVTLLRSV